MYTVFSLGVPGKPKTKLFGLISLCKNPA